MKNIFFILALIALFSKGIHAQTPYELPKLNYAFDALEPYVDSTTMYIHYNKHHAAYIANLNKAIQGTEAEKIALQEVLKHISKYSDAVRNNAGGHYNHSLFWEVLTPKKTVPSEKLTAAIKAQYGSLDSLRTLMEQKGLKQFGSGWVWLILNEQNKLEVCATANQDNPLMDVATVKGTPILGIDVWEHAYYLKYQNKRGEYLKNIWSVIHWEYVSSLYEQALMGK